MTAIVRFSYVVAVLFCSALVAAQPVAQAQDYADAAGEITVVDLYAKAPSSNIGDRSGFVAQVTLSRTQDSTYGGNINCDTKPGQKPDEYVSRIYVVIDGVTRTLTGTFPGRMCWRPIDQVSDRAADGQGLYDKHSGRRVCSPCVIHHLQFCPLRNCIADSRSRGATVEYGSITMKDQKNMNCDTTTLGPDTVYCSPVRVPISLALTAQS